MVFFLSKRRKNKKPRIEPEEVLADMAFPHDDLRPDITQLEVPVQKTAFSLLLVLTAGIFLVFAGRLAYLQTRGGEDLRALARDNREAPIYSAAPRGEIRDRNGFILGSNEEAYRLVAYATELPPDAAQLSRLAAQAAQTLLVDPVWLLERLTKEVLADPKQEGVALLPVSYDTAQKFLESKEAFPGLAIKRAWKRVYPQGDIFAHTVGFLGRITKEELAKHPSYLPNEFIGKTGIEAAYEEMLRGRPEKIMKIHDAKGRLRNEFIAEAPEPGKDIALTIDRDLQNILTQTLIARTQYLKRPKQFGAAAVALDPRSGEILALVSLPSFDPNLFVEEGSKNISDAISSLLQDERQPLFNRAIAGAYPPGSTIKPFVATAALGEKIISPWRKVRAPQAIAVQSVFDPSVSWVFRDWRDHGLVNLFEAIAFSSDVYFYTVGGGYGGITGLGSERLSAWLSRAGFGTKLGIDIPGEQKGLVPTPVWKQEVKGETWYLGDTYHEAIGQGDVTATPLQLAVATAAIVNGGTLWQPHLNLALEPQPITAEKLADAETLNTVRKGMRDAVAYGTAKLLRDLPVQAGGKTGTAQFGAKQYTHAWFSVFAPYENPEIVLVVLVEGGGEGSAVAVPVANEVLQWYFAERRVDAAF